MQYSTPQLTNLGSLAELTLGQNGSCLDGNSHNNLQRGGGDVGQGTTGKNGCGQSG